VLEETALATLATLVVVVAAALDSDSEDSALEVAVETAVPVLRIVELNILIEVVATAVDVVEVLMLVLPCDEQRDVRVQRDDRCVGCL
jgi:BarA-like signal transduction histidine kinase